MTGENVDGSNLTENTDADPAPAADSSTSAESGTSPEITFMGNSYDLMSVVGVTVGGLTLFTCATCNMGFYCLPCIPILLGILGLAVAKESVDPDRTRLLSWLGLGSGALILALIFLAFALYLGFIIFAITMDSSGF